MRLLRLLSVSLILTTFLSKGAGGQVSWTSVPLHFNNEVRFFYVDSADTTLYIGGNFDSVNNKYTGSIIHIDRQYNILPLPVSKGLPLFGIIKWGGKLFTGVTLSVLEDTAWKVLDLSGDAHCFYPYQGKLLIGGSFPNGLGGDTTLKGATILEYDGANFRKFKGVDTVITSYSVDAIVEYNGELIVAGNFDPYPPLDPAYKEIIKWTGTKWAPVGNGIPGSGLDFVGDLKVINDKLYVGGVFWKSYGSPGNCVASWNGIKWDDMGGGSLGNAIYSFDQRNDTLFVAGVMGDMAGQYCSHFAAYHEGKWSGNMVPMDNSATRVVNFFGDILVGGGFQMIGADSFGRIAKVKSLGSFFTPVSIETIETNGAMKLVAYPNPATDELHIGFSIQTMQKLTLDVMDMYGRTACHKTINAQPGNNHATLSIADVPAGMYVLRLHNSEYWAAAKIIKR